MVIRRTGDVVRGARPGEAAGAKGASARPPTTTAAPEPGHAAADEATARRVVGTTSGERPMPTSAEGARNLALALRTATPDPAGTPAEVAGARLDAWQATARAAGPVLDVGGGLGLSTVGAGAFVAALGPYAVTGRMLAAPGFDLAASPIAFLADGQRAAFAQAYAERTGEAPDPAAAAWVLPRAEGPPVVVVPAARRAPASAPNVLFSLRQATGYDERSFVAADAAAVVARVTAGLQAVMRGPRDAAAMTTLRDLLDHALTADATKPAVKDVVDAVVATMRRVRAKTGASASGAGAPDALVAAAHAGGDAAKIADAHRRDDQQLQAHVDGAIALHDVANRVAAATDEGWIDATKQALRTHAAQAWRRFDVVDLAAFDARVPGAAAVPGMEHLVAAGNDRASFVAWTERLIDDVAARCATHADPDVRAAFAERRLSTSVLEEVCAERATALGFAGLHAIDPSAGIISADEFLGILGRGDLILDPYFASEQKHGAHGHHSHVLQWLYLAEQAPDAAATYRTLGRAGSVEHRALLWDALYETRAHSFAWSMTPEQLTPLLQAFLPIY